MLKSFLLAEAPDGGFGFRISKDSRLSIEFVGSVEDMYIAERAMNLCQFVIGKELLIAGVLNKALVSTGVNVKGESVEKMVHLRVNKDILLDIAKDEDNPLETLEEELDAMFHFIRFIHLSPYVMEDKPFGIEIGDFLMSFYLAVSCLFDKNPLDCGAELFDMEWLQAQEDWELVNENMKVMYSIQLEDDEDGHQME